MKLIDKDAVMAEIERRIKVIIDDNGNLGFKDCQKAFNEIDELKKFIDTLEVKEVDLNKELNEFIEQQKAWIKDDWVVEYNNGDSFNHIYDLEDIAKHFFELGLKASNPLTWEDIKTLQDKSGEVYAEVAKGKDDFYSIYPTEQSFLEEVLKRFKAQKGGSV